MFEFEPTTIQDAIAWHRKEIVRQSHYASYAHTFGDEDKVKAFKERRDQHKARLMELQQISRLQKRKKVSDMAEQLKKEIG